MLHSPHILVAVAAFCFSGPGPEQNASRIVAYQPVPLAVDGASPIHVDLPGGQAGANFLLIVGTPDAAAKKAILRIDVQETSTAEPLKAATPVAPADWLKKVDSRRQAMAARRKLSAGERSPTVAAKFPQRRGFHLFVKDGSFQDAKNYQQVTAELAAVGKQCVVYVDVDDQPAKFPRATLEEVVRTFDEQVFPNATELFGRRRDVDRDGRFTILFSHWLGTLSDGKISLGGFVRGGDFYRDVEAPFGNQCDMLYLNSALKPGPHLRTLIAHEYTHAVTFCEHVFGDYLPGEWGADEEGWLNEAMSHLAENLYGGGSWSNLDYRISAYLNAPHKYRLVVPDYYREGLFRCHGCRGATFLMLRWCVDRHGVGLLKELSQSGLVGTENLETATRTPFAELFRQWTYVLCLQSSVGATGAREWLPSARLGERLGNFQLAGPRPIDLEQGTTVQTLEATSFAPLQVRVPAGKSLRVVVQPLADAAVQATLVKLPDDLPRATLSAAPVRTTSTKHKVEVSLRHLSGTPVRWERMSWERETPPAFREGEEAPQPNHLRADELFARPSTVAGQQRISDQIDIPRDAGPIVFKLVGVDPLGRRVAAWATWDSSNPGVPVMATTERGAAR